MDCLKCGTKLSGKQTSYCSTKCGRLYLKSLYRKRNREKINSYNRKYKRNQVPGNPSTNKTIREYLENNPSCQKCGTLLDVQACHIKPRWADGKNKDNLISLCRKHHFQFDELLRNFWKPEVT